MFVCCECCVLSGRGLCDKLITRPEESYRLWCVVVCDLETSRMRSPWPALGRSATGGGGNEMYYILNYIQKNIFIVLPPHPSLNFAVLSTWFFHLHLVLYKNLKIFTCMYTVDTNSYFSCPLYHLFITIFCSKIFPSTCLSGGTQ